VTVNLLSEKAGITNEQVETALAKEFAKIVERKSTGPQAESSAADSGNRGPYVLSTASNGNDTLSVEPPEHDEAQGRESQAGDSTPAARSECVANPGFIHQAQDFRFNALDRTYTCRGCELTVTELDFTEAFSGPPEHH
jgi:hypothetical protein